MSKKGSNWQFYISHSNPHNLDFETFKRRIHRTEYTKEEAMSFPNLGKGGDRKTKRFHSIKPPTKNSIDNIG